MPKLEPPKPNLWDVFTKRELPSLTIDFPANGPDGKPLCKVTIRVLSQADHIRIQTKAIAEADKLFADEGIKIDRDSQTYQDRYHNIAAKHFLFDILRDPESPNLPFAPTPDMIAAKLLPDEVAILMQQWKRLNDEQGTVIAYLAPDQLEAKIEELAKEAEKGGYFLERFLPEAKDQLLIFMANRLLTSPINSSLPSSPASVSTNE